MSCSKNDVISQKKPEVQTLYIPNNMTALHKLLCFVPKQSMSIRFAVGLFLFCAVLCAGRFVNFHHGNELQQFEAYEKLTKQLINETEFFHATNLCERSTVPENGFRSYMCRYKLREQREKVMSPLWPRTADNGKYKTDCKYRLHGADAKIIEGNIERGSLVFEIEQLACHATLAIHGGATFEIYLQSSRHLAVCNVFDQFNYKYKVYCPLPSDFDVSPVTSLSPPPLPTLAAGSQHVCSDVSVTLHYEHFDAFDDVGHSKFSSLHHGLYKGPVCAQYTPGASSASISSSAAQNSGKNTIHSTSDDPSSDPLWLVRPLSAGSPYYVNEQLHQSLYGEKTAIFEWRGQVAKYLTVSAMKKCLKRQTLWFVGESHMRYQFDITMDRYVDKLNMGRYHGSVNVSGVSYADNTFSTRLIKMLDELPCPRSKSEWQQPQTLVLQTGSWDLQFFPPRAYIRNPKQGLGVAEAIERLKSRPFCADVYKIVWMSTMPHPYCVAANEHCIRLMNYWRNNGAIRAVNSMMEEALARVNYPGLVVLDTPSIALPRFPLNDIVCVDHFLCNDQPRGFITTPTGIALGNEVLTYSCAEEMRLPGATFRDGGLIKFRNSTTAQVHYYSIEGGCRREFPDDPTMRLMGAQPELFTEVNAQYVHDIPVCFRTHFLTRTNGTLYQTYSTKSVYYMDSGYKRQLNGVDALISLGKEFKDVVFVLEKDFERIPQGRTILGKNDCDWCKGAGRT